MRAAKSALPAPVPHRQIGVNQLGVSVGVIHANLAALIETAGVLYAAAFAIVTCGVEALLIGVERPSEHQNDQADDGRREDQKVSDGSPC